MNPYTILPDHAFWRKAIADKSPFDINGLWQPKAIITKQDPVVTYGSCFAQHISKALNERGFRRLVTEVAPLDCSVELAARYHYGVFSARTGNIYTTSLLAQWLSWALDESSVPQEYWQNGGRYIDPFRPAIEPEGFISIEEMQQSRLYAIRRFKKSIIKAKFFVFTLGLTESWFNKEHGYEYPLCPGTVAGEFDADKHQFVNQDIDQVRTRLVFALKAIRKLNKNIRVILTTSPVPLTATASGEHVLVATVYSKSVLRAVAGVVSQDYDWVDYFPSYEIINSSPFGGIFFESNKRSVNTYGVNFVMDSFFNCMYPNGVPVEKKASRAVLIRRKQQKPQLSYKNKVGQNRADRNKIGEICEEALLDAFGGKK
jgi:hypothetical protein